MKTIVSMVIEGEPAADIGKPAAGKTGTTDNYKDAWFVGYTPDVVTGVWVGKDDNSNMKVPLTGGTVPALIWRDVMSIATEQFGSREFAYPEVQLKKGGVKPEEEVLEVTEDVVAPEDGDNSESQGEDVVEEFIPAEPSEAPKVKLNKKSTQTSQDKFLPAVKIYDNSAPERRQEEVSLPAPIPATPKAPVAQ